MDKSVKSAIAVVSALVMLAIAAYLTVSTVNAPKSTPAPPLPQPSASPTAAASSSFFNFHK